MFKKLALICLFLLLGSCGSSGGGDAGDSENKDLVNGDEGKPLANTQRVIFGNLVASLEAIDHAGREENLDYPNFAEMKQRLRTSDCETKIENPGAPPATGDYDYTYTFDVTGTNCPISQTAVTVLGNRHIKNTYGSHKVRYLVKDATYASYNDVVQLDFDDAMTVNYTLQTGGMLVAGRGQGVGYIRSQALGDIKITTETGARIQFTSDRANGATESVMRVSINDFIIVLRARQFLKDNQLQPVFRLNGTEISQDQYFRLTKYFAPTDAGRATKNPLAFFMSR